ncbi:MAG: hypothetical protein P8Y03_17260 [Anaerolineales bacterium]
MLTASSPPQRWSPDLCFGCPVPDILRANACSHMVLEGYIERPFPYIKRKVQVKAYCTKTLRDVAEPRIGCGECHLLPPIFSGEMSDPNAAA